MVSPGVQQRPGTREETSEIRQRPTCCTDDALFVEAAQLLELCKLAKAVAVKGRRPVEKTVEQLRDETFNTGVCAICINRQKLTDATKMVMHGYQMSDYNHAGYRVGSCFGVGYKPYELSNEANLAFAPVLEIHRLGLENALQTWASGKITSVDITREKREGGSQVEYTVTYTLAANPAEFNREKETRVARLESELRMIDADIRVNNDRIQKWTLQPLMFGSKADTK